jgi:hypothetical protein
MAATINGASSLDNLVVPAQTAQPRRAQGGPQFDEHLDRAMDRRDSGRPMRGGADQPPVAESTERAGRASSERQRIERVAARHRRTDERADDGATTSVDTQPVSDDIDEPMADAHAVVAKVVVEQPVVAPVLVPPPIAPMVVPALTVAAVAAVPDPTTATVDSVTDAPSADPVPPVMPATTSPDVGATLETAQPAAPFAIADAPAALLDGAASDVARGDAPADVAIPAQVASVAPAPTLVLPAQQQVVSVATPSDTRRISGTSAAGGSAEGDAPQATGAQPDQAAADATASVAVITAVDAMRAMRATIAKASSGADRAVLSSADAVVESSDAPAAVTTEGGAPVQRTAAAATPIAAPAGAFMATTARPQTIPHTAATAAGAPADAGAGAGVARPAQADGLPVSLPSLSMDLSDEGLGPLMVHASTTSTGLHLKLTAGDRSVGDLLSRAGGELRRDLEAGGTRVGTIDITHDASPQTTHGGSSNDRQASTAAFADQGQTGRRPSTGSGLGSASPDGSPIVAGRPAASAAPTRIRPIVGADGVDVRI